MKLLFDFFPVVLFFIAYKLYGIFVATAVAMVGSFLQVLVYWLKYRRFETMHLVTFFMILLLGGATLLLHDVMFIKWKPSVVYWLLALGFLGTQVFPGNPLIQRMMGKQVNVPALVWSRLNIAWCVFFTLMGAANLYVAYTFSTNTWVNFKLFGTLGLTLLFIVLQSFYMIKYVTDPETKTP